MRGKIARELRRIAKFVPKEEREYQTFTMTVKKMQTYQFGHNPDDPNKPSIRLVEKEVPRYLTECISGPRKVYQHLKRFYNGFTETSEYHELPTQEELDKLADNIKQQEENDSTNSKHRE